MRFTRLPGLLLAFASPVAAQTARLTGRVLDAEQGTPIAGAIDSFTG